MNRKIFFRADADMSIGYGHFIRTLALADMLKDTFECVFFTQSPTDYQRKEMERVCHFVELPGDDRRFDFFLDYLSGEEIVVLDNYFYTTDYQLQIKNKGCKLVCIDDMHDKHYVADVVVNHGLAESQEFDCEPYTRLCLGLDWSLLRKPFLLPIHATKRLDRIIVCFGGSDPQRLSDKVVTMLLQLSVEQEIVVILGDTAYLSEENRQRVTIMHNLTAWQMADLFETSMYGIMPASSVRMEAVSRGLKTIAGYFVDNQRIGFDRSLALQDIVPIYNYAELTIERLSSAMEQLRDFHFVIPDYSRVPDNYISLFASL